MHNSALTNDYDFETILDPDTVKLDASHFR